MVVDPSDDLVIYPHRRKLPLAVFACALVAITAFQFVPAANVVCAPQNPSQRVESVAVTNARTLFDLIRKLERLRLLKTTDIEKILGVQISDHAREFLWFEPRHQISMSKEQLSYPGDPLSKNMALTANSVSRIITIRVSPACQITAQMVRNYFGKPTSEKREANEVDDYANGAEFFDATRLVYERKKGFTEFIAVQCIGVGRRPKNSGDNLVTSVRVCDRGRYTVH